MKLGRINSLYEPNLSDNNMTLTEENSLTKQTLFYTHNFDNRVKLFNSILQSSLFKNQNVSRSDLQFWFPECMDTKTESNSKFINKEKITHSIECFLAEIMEDEIG